MSLDCFRSLFICFKLEIGRIFIFFFLNIISIYYIIFYLFTSLYNLKSLPDDIQVSVTEMQFKCSNQEEQLIKKKEEERVDLIYT